MHDSIKYCKFQCFMESFLFVNPHLEKNWDEKARKTSKRVLAFIYSTVPQEIVFIYYATTRIIGKEWNFPIIFMFAFVFKKKTNVSSSLKIDWGERTKNSWLVNIIPEAFFGLSSDAVKFLHTHSLLTGFGVNCEKIKRDDSDGWSVIQSP